MKIIKTEGQGAKLIQLRGNIKCIIGKIKSNMDGKIQEMDIFPFLLYNENRLQPRVCEGHPSGLPPPRKGASNMNSPQPGLSARVSVSHMELPS